MDAAPLEHTHRLAGSKLSVAGVQIGQSALDLRGSHTGKLRGGGTGSGKCHHIAVRIVLHRGSEHDLVIAAAGAGLDDHIRLSRITPRKTVGHTGADHLGIQCHG